MTRVRLLRDGAVGRVILARPEKKNAIDRQMADDLFAAREQHPAGLRSDETRCASDQNPHRPVVSGRTRPPKGDIVRN